MGPNALRRPPMARGDAFDPSRRTRKPAHSLAFRALRAMKPHGSTDGGHMDDDTAHGMRRQAGMTRQAARLLRLRRWRLAY
jgi:hypothetical protein